MSAGPTRRGLLGGLLAALVGLPRLFATAPAGPACPHPLHRPLLGDRPGPGPWYRAYLSLPCPRCGQPVEQRGYLPGVAYACSFPLQPPPPRITRDGLVTHISYEDGSAAAEGPRGVVNITAYEGGRPQG